MNELPREPEVQEEIKFVELLSTAMVSDNAVIRSLLDAEGIHYYLQGDIGFELTCSVPVSRLLVRMENVEKAKDILKDFL